MAKLFFMDLETTGVDPNKNGITQISGIIEINGVTAETFNTFVKPFRTDEIITRALEVSGTSVDMLDTFPDPQDVYESLVETLSKYVNKYDKKDKFHIVGYNSRFDDSFLRSFFQKNNDKYYGSFFYWPAIDVSNMAALELLEIRYVMRDFKLMTVAEFVGIEVDKTKAHDSLYDIEITRKLFQHFKNMTDCIKGSKNERKMG